MRKTILLNSKISYEISKIGHGQSLCIGDCGLPVPKGIKRIDLAVSAGIPSFIQVLKATLNEMQIEKVLLAKEIKRNKNYNKQIELLLKEANPKVKIEYTSHEKFKKETVGCVAIVRTGEQTPFANILLYSGVVF